MQDIKEQLASALDEFIPQAKLKPGQILVIGCSTSEVAGAVIGKAGNLTLAEELFAALDEAVTKWNLYLAVQCCEHLNRALVVSRACQEKYNLSEVSVVPAQQAGGAMATVAYRRMQPDVCMVDSISAHAGLDIGQTLIGMQLRPVAVPVRLSQKTIGHAILTAARTRPPLIGGARAIYENS